MKTIVSVTLLPFSADTLTFKIATFFARFGYRFIVVAGAKSNLDSVRLTFVLRSDVTFPSSKGRALSSRGSPKPKNDSNLKQHVKRWMKHLPEPIQNTVLGFFPFPIF